MPNMSNQHRLVGSKLLLPTRQRRLRAGACTKFSRGQTEMKAAVLALFTESRDGPKNDPARQHWMFQAVPQDSKGMPAKKLGNSVVHPRLRAVATGAIS